MAPIKLERIISVSSEDPAHPAENLLKRDYGGQKWKCKSAGEKQISIVIQFEKPSVISSVDVGNLGSAFIEILVAKSSQPDEYKVLVAASMLMSLQDAKLGTNLTGVKFLKEEHMSDAVGVAGVRWDRVRVVCTQPYNTSLQYGLSFLVFRSPEPASANPASSAVLGMFQLKPRSVSPPIPPGSLFARRNLVSPPPVSGAAAIRVASVSALTSNKVPSQCRLKDPTKQGFSSGGESCILNPSLPNGNGTKTPKRKANPSRKVKDVATNGAVSQKGGGASTSSERPKKKKEENATKKRVERPFRQLLEGLVFSISGIQNPLRGQLRSKALAMGAKYRPDWDPTCTHLICAFPNTPKFNQVLGRGKIVTKEWLETCHSRRMRLPWRRYALHPPDKRAPESDEEVWEAVASGGDSRRRANSPSTSEEDTEEEVERIRQIQMQKQKVALNNGKTTKPASKEETKQDGPVVTSAGGDVYEMDTEGEEEPVGGQATIPSHLYLPALPSLLEGVSFCIDVELPEEERKTLRRYIVANKGTLVEDITEDTEVKYFVSESSLNVQRMQSQCPQVTGVRPEWVWRAHDEGRLIPVAPFQL